MPTKKKLLIIIVIIIIIIIISIIIIIIIMITTYRIFLKFYLKLEEHKGQKQTTSIFSAKLSDLGKSQKNSYKIGVFFGFCRKFDLFVFFYPKIGA